MRKQEYAELFMLTAVDVDVKNDPSCLGPSKGNETHLFNELEELALRGRRVSQQQDIDVSAESGTVRQVLLK